jgi:excinuclease UvrABC nuclease subunit
MWPRSLFKKKDEKGRLRIKIEAPDIERPGVYVLYKGDELYYVGKATRLMSRLHDHANKVTDEYYAHWDYFSAFVLTDAVIDPKQQLAQLEAILIAAMPRATNKATPRFTRVQIPKSLRLDD